MEEEELQMEASKQAPEDQQLKLMPENNKLNYTTSQTDKDKSNEIDSSLAHHLLGTSKDGDISGLKAHNTKQRFTKFEVNHGFLLIYSITVLFGNAIRGYAAVCNNQVGPVINAQFNLETQQQQNLYNTFIGSAVLMGNVIGAIFGGKLLQYRRRKMQIIVIILGILATIPTMFLNFYLIFFGRFCIGITAGIQTVLGMRMLEETVPFYLLGIYGPFNIITLNFGQVIAGYLGGTILYEDGVPKVDTGLWRVIYGFVWVLLFTQLFLFLFVIKEEPLNYLISQKSRDERQLRTMIKNVYKMRPDLENDVYDPCQVILEQLEKSGSKQSDQNISTRDAMFGPDYWRSTWFSFILVVLIEFGGTVAIIFYSTTIFERISGGSITPNIGTMMVGTVNMAGGLLAIVTVSKFKRKTLFLITHMLSSIILTILGLAIYYDKGNLALIMILLYLVSFQNGDGSLEYIYTSEVVIDSGLGFVVFGIKGAGLIVSISTEFLMDSVLQPYGCFWMFGCVQLISFFYILFLLKETYGMIDVEKKQLYKDSCGAISCKKKVKTEEDEDAIMEENEESENS